MKQTLDFSVSEKKVINFFTLIVIFFLFTFILKAEGKVDSWLDWEIERNDLSYNSSIFSALPGQEELQLYQVSEIYALEVSRKYVRDFSQTIPIDQDKVVFYIHPKALNLFTHLISKGNLHKIKVKPTSSPRTFYLGDNQMVKLSLPQQINGGIRTIYPLQMTRALSVSKMLGEIPFDLKEKYHFNFLPETKAVYDGTPNSPFGFIIREIPKRIVKENYTLVPLFAFLAKNKNIFSLLEESANRLGVTPSIILRQQIIPSLMQSYSLAAYYGVVLEAHQQNVLLELDSDHNFTGEIYYRDLDGARVDFSQRTKMGLPTVEYLALPDANWVFDFENVNQIVQNRSRLIDLFGRPKWWSPLIEESFQKYIVGSSLYLINQYLSNYSTDKEIKTYELVPVTDFSIDLFHTKTCQSFY